MQKTGSSHGRKVLRERTEDYVTIEEVAQDLGMTKPGARWGMQALGVEFYKLPYDKRTYITKEDARRIIELRKAARD